MFPCQYWLTGWYWKTSSSTGCRGSFLWLNSWFYGHTGLFWNGRIRRASSSPALSETHRPARRLFFHFSWQQQKKQRANCCPAPPTPIISQLIDSLATAWIRSSQVGLNSGSSRSNNRSSGSSGSGHRTAHERSTNLHAAAEAEFHSRRRWAASQSPVFPTSFSLSPAETIAYLRVGASTGRRLIFRSSLFSSTTSTITTATQAVSTVDCFARNNRLRRGGFDSFWRPARVIHHRDVTRLKLNPIQIQVWVGGTTTQYNNRPPTLPNRSDGGLLLKKKNSVDIFMGVEGVVVFFTFFAYCFMASQERRRDQSLGSGRLVVAMGFSWRQW